MKITKQAEMPGLRIDETRPGEVYFYRSEKNYVIRREYGTPAFVGLEDGGGYSGKDGELFRVNAELVIS